MTDLCIAVGLPLGPYTEDCTACVTFRVSYALFHRCKLQCTCGTHNTLAEIGYDRRWSRATLPRVRFIDTRLETYWEDGQV